MKKGFRKFIALAVMVSVIFVQTIPASASVKGMTSTPLDYMVYHDVLNWGIQDNSVISYFTLDGKAAFCTQSGRAIRGTGDEFFYPAQSNAFNIDFDISVLTDDDSIQSKCAYLGYYSLSKPTMKDYAFTQMFIWQTLPEEDRTANGKLPSGEYRSYFLDDDVAKEYDEWKNNIQRKIDSWDTKPEFSDQTIDITAGTTINLIDKNEVLEDYAEFSYSINGIIVKHDAKSNILNVTADEKCTASSVSLDEEQLIIAGAHKYYSEEKVNYIYSADKSQDMAIYGMTKPISMNLNFNVLTFGSLKVIKSAEGGYVSGISFVVENADKTFSKKIETDKNGIAIISDLPIGEYVITEITPNGYVAQSSKNITIEAQKTSTVTFDNVLQKGMITVIKQGDVFTDFNINDNGEYIPIYSKIGLCGAVYEIVAAEDFKSANGAVIQKAGDVVDTIITNEKGEATSKELYLGKYIVREKTPPKGYVTCLQEEEVILEYSGEHVEVFNKTITVENKRQKIEVSLQKALELDKYGQLSTEILDSVTFGVYAAEDIYVYDNSKNIEKNALMSIIYVDKSGKAVYNGDLPDGKYYIREISVDEHYLASEAEYEFETCYDTSGDELVNVIINNGEPILNEYIKCKLTIVKTDIQTGQLLKDVGFKLYNSDGKEIAEGYTDEDGVLEFVDLPVGEYSVVEFKTAEGYILNEDPFYVSLTADEIAKTIRISNTSVPKTDDDTNMLMWIMIGLEAVCMALIGNRFRR